MAVIPSASAVASAADRLFEPPAGLLDEPDEAAWLTASRELAEAFTAAGVESDIQNAGGDKAKFAEYEKKYKPLTGDLQPKVVAADVKADIFPSEQRARLNSQGTK